MIYGRKNVIAGVILFLIIAVSPIWYNAFTGKAHYVPELTRPTDVKECVESTPYMRANHTKMLTRWKEMVVRTGRRTYGAEKDGKTYTISLSGTCLSCHSNKAEFCDKCHNYAGVKPVCWNCHNAPNRTVRSGEFGVMSRAREE